MCLHHAQARTLVNNNPVSVPLHQATSQRCAEPQQQRELRQRRRRAAVVAVIEHEQSARGAAAQEDNGEGVRACALRRHGVQNAEHRRERLQLRCGAAAAEQVQDEAPGPQSLLPHHGGVGAQNGHPHSNHHGSGRRGAPRGAAVVSPQGRFQISPSNEARRPGQSLRQLFNGRFPVQEPAGIRTDNSGRSGSACPSLLQLQ